MEKNVKILTKGCALMSIVFVSLFLFVFIFTYNEEDRDKAMYVDDKTLVIRYFSFYDENRDEMNDLAKSLQYAPKFGKEFRAYSYKKPYGHHVIVSEDDGKNYTSSFFGMSNVLRKYYGEWGKMRNWVYFNDYQLEIYRDNLGFRNRHGSRAYLLYARCSPDTLAMRFPDFVFPTRFQIPPKHLETDTGSFIITYDTPSDADKWFYKIDEGWYVVSP